MLQPFGHLQNVSADALMAAVTLRDESLTVDTVREIKTIDGNRHSVMIDDYLTPQPLDEVAKYLGAPSTFLANCDVGLAQYVIDHQLKKVKTEKELVLRNGKVIGSQLAHSKRIQGAEAVEKLIAAVGDVRHANMYDMGNYVDITLVGDKVTLKPKVNDITEGGVRFLYSEMLARQPQLEPYVERLVCTNGMIMKDILQVFQFDNMDNFIRGLEQSVVKALNFVDTTIRAQLEKAVETKVERSEQALRQIFESNRLNTKLLPATIGALTTEEDGTAFGVLQAITRAANTAGYSHRITLQEVGAREMARLETVHCPTCWSSLVH